MRIFTKLFLAFFLIVAGGVAAFAAETRVVPANRVSAIFYYYTGSMDTCHSGGKPKPHITRQPEHGTITTVWKPFRMGKEAGRCAGKSMHATFVIYKPTPGYRGPDKVSIIFKSGATTGYFLTEKEWRFNIVVK